MLNLRTLFKEYNLEIGKIMESELINLKLLDHDVKQTPKTPYIENILYGTSHYFRIRCS